MAGPWAQDSNPKNKITCYFTSKMNLFGNKRNWNWGQANYAKAEDKGKVNFY